MNRELSFIIIDDSELDCYVTQKFLQRANQNLIIKTFNDAQEALELIRENNNFDVVPPTIILLDLQMPVMSGFKFVEEFEKIPAEIQKKYVIIVLTVLSSSNDPKDIYKILTFKTVKSLVEKPLTLEKLASLLKHVPPAGNK
ncbi:response regulator [Mucilaginibacter gotjawali]|uniref:Chemotaxis-specific methylesterase n=2 Tax=Mucilaginibacter gotjawali TaxID=1550579 RepID=A0A0X8X4Q4_9SPHI|nr:response regulator [Mucilaginibacter gotjawali]MBB3056119.1 CheY-like chemotaxis protein [Mucilaginibacter gotjawali]BAU53544.1 chemotaxis-specific methylesterase [Mucilaginibacter gotjawali]